MQSSKKNVYVLRENVLFEQEQLIKDKSVQIPRRFVNRPSDSLRYLTGKYWVSTPKTLTYGDPERAARFDSNIGVDISYGKTLVRILRNPPFVVKQQKICLVGDKLAWEKRSFSDWQEFVAGVTPDNDLSFRDLNFRIDVPFNQMERKKIGDVSGIGFVDIDFKYNFYQQNYEESIISIREEFLPNIYSFISDDISNNMLLLRTLQDTLDRKKANIRRNLRDNLQTIRPTIFTKQVYFGLAARVFRKAKQKFLTNFYKKYQNFIVPFENLDLISDMTLKESFPMFVEVRFSTDSVTEVAQILEDASLSTSLQRHLAAGFNSQNSSLLKYLGGTSDQYFVSEQNLSYFANHTGGNRVRVGNYKSLDLITWWKNYMNGFIPRVFSDQTFVGPDTKSIYISSGKQNNNLTQALSLLIFSGKLQEIVKAKTRSIEQIMNGAAGHSETVVYRVAKYLGNDTNSQPIQNYWFPNSNNIDVIDFVDTQVKYNRVYTYRVYAYQLVIGSEYSYGEIKYPEPTTELDCPDISFPRLVCDIERDIPVIYRALDALNTNTAFMNSVSKNLLTVFVYSGSLRCLRDPKYFLDLVAHVSARFGFDTVAFASNFASFLKTYPIGSIEEIVVPAVQRQVQPDNPFAACIDTTAYPFVKIVEVPFFSHTGRMIDSPSLPPDVNIVPYRGENNKSLILLNSTIGEQVTFPIVIDPEDRQYFQQIRKNNFLAINEPITFRSDDPADYFEILRLDSKPERYTDFTSASKINLTTIIDNNSGKRASAASFVDNVQPNRKYYYTFRAVDIHRNKSNPTKVFEVELVDNDGAVYMIVNIIDLEVIPEPYDPTIQAKKLVHIIPRITQGVFNQAKSGLEDKDSALAKRGYALGVEDESIWGKKFKIRFISKSTGRKIDLNVNYNIRHVVTEEEKELRQSK